MTVPALDYDQNIKTMFGAMIFWKIKHITGRNLRILNIIDEYSRECLLSFASRRITSSEVVEFLAELFCNRGLPEYIRSDNGS